MFNPLKNLRDLTNLQQQAQKMQAALSQERVTKEHAGVTVVLTGDQQVERVIIDGVDENRVAEAINLAIKDTQRLAATKLLELSSQQEGQQQ
ncbi:hypothetical protein A2690_04640 [Candidatus Roizmanbacteria bacterium RIFCSPHIGHO2_01_FULL_39_12b]|uniref:Nucleoid-associated protein, YbaB/EbfC family n=1 Tax=Candidatus Roizmanbacteria bacterium RIFCSPHIGHO2_01_FULL_39_12b TaxID=1802030 RepID=A0A1F7G7Z6_9BACT|nr:MAG: hypothetical protein A2690_04640 [Candidatus Roizmanbacteria bacterium RIFCSPHIGHO2_01_FULL_39_12b]